MKNIWRPDSFFKNAKAVTFQTMTIPNHYMWLYKDKTILYMVKYDFNILLTSVVIFIIKLIQYSSKWFFVFRLTLTLSCAMNFMIYPHDTQECKLQMESCKIKLSFNSKTTIKLKYLIYFSVSYHWWHDIPMGSRGTVGCRWKHWIASIAVS